MIQPLRALAPDRLEQVLKVSHHGSSTATGAAFVAAVDPAVAVVESGAFNSYGHPDQAVVKRLQDSGAKVYSTVSSGTVRIAATRTGYAVVAADGPELPVTVPGAALPPTDPDFDGDFEDANGNQRRDFADIVMVFNQLDWIAANEPAGSTLTATAGWTSRTSSGCSTTSDPFSVRS